MNYCTDWELILEVDTFQIPFFFFNSMTPELLENRTHFVIAKTAISNLKYMNK